WRPVAVAAVAEGIKAHARDEVTVRIGDRLHTPQVIKMQVAFGGCAGGGFAQVIAANVGFAGQAVGAGFSAVSDAGVVVRGCTTADGFHLVMGRAVDELAIVYARGLVEHVALRGAAAESGYIAVGIVAIVIAARWGYAVQAGAVGL